jgi:hypothetical protein
MTGIDCSDLGKITSAPAVRGATSPKERKLVHTVARHKNTVTTQGRWSVKLQRSLFHSYGFVRLNGLNRSKVITSLGVVNPVSFQGLPAPVPDDLIIVIWNGLRFRRDHLRTYPVSVNRIHRKLRHNRNRCGVPRASMYRSWKVPFPFLGIPKHILLSSEFRNAGSEPVPPAATGLCGEVPLMFQFSRVCCRGST